MTYILIAEDDPFIQLLVTRKLQASGYEVRATAFGDDALKIAARARPLIILLDVMLPDRNGLGVCAQLKTSFGADAPPVIIVSARGQNEDLQAARDAGADDYLIKPFAPNELLMRVQTLLNV